MTTPTSTGMNRTGMQMSPMLAGKLMEISEERESRPGEEITDLVEARESFYRESSPVGTVPPAGSMKGMATTVMEMIKGHKPTVLIDKLGERLAFERTGVRLYEAVLAKHEALGSWDGGPSRDQLMHIRDEELQHFQMLEELIKGLGADPTAMTPSADITALEGSGPLKVISDPRTTLSQAMHALLVIEAADVEGWNMLIQLADAIGQSDMADRFRTAEQTEQQHMTMVRQWLSRSVLADAERQLSSAQGGG